MEREKIYEVVISEDALWDIESTKRYILRASGYREYAEEFSEKIRGAIEELESFPTRYRETGYVVEDLSIYCKVYATYRIFFVVEDSTVTVVRVLKNNMFWQSVIKNMWKINR